MCIQQQNMTTKASFVTIGLLVLCLFIVSYAVYVYVTPSHENFHNPTFPSWMMNQQQSLSDGRGAMMINQNFPYSMGGDCCCEESESEPEEEPVYVMPEPLQEAEPETCPNPDPIPPASTPLPTPTMSPLTPANNPTPIPSTVFTSAPTTSSSPHSAPASQITTAIITNPAPILETSTSQDPFCARPQHVVCEIPIPDLPIFSINAFTIGDVALGSGVQYTDKTKSITSTSPESRPILKENKYNDVVVRYLQINNNIHTLNVDQDSHVAKLVFTPKTNKGYTIVMVARIITPRLDRDQFSYTSVGKTGLKLTQNESFKYYVNKNNFMLVMKTVREKRGEDDQILGSMAALYVNLMEDEEAIQIKQSQEELQDASLAEMVLLHDKTEQNQDSTKMEVDLVYLGLYDRPLNMVERMLIKKSVEPIINHANVEKYNLEVQAEYDITTMDAAQLEANPDLQRIVRDQSPNRFNLVYNVEGGSIQYRLTQTQTKCIELTKNEKLFTPSPGYIDTITHGYSVELLFCIKELSDDNDSVILSYTITDLNIRLPQLIVGVSSNQRSKLEGKGARLSVFFAHDLPRFECLVNMVTSKWYHVIITSDSRIFLNGESAPTLGRAVTWLPDMNRTLTIGDYKTTDSYRVSSDYGNTIHGYVALARVYNAPINDEIAKNKYTHLRDLDGNAYGI